MDLPSFPPPSPTSASRDPAAPQTTGMEGAFARAVPAGGPAAALAVGSRARRGRRRIAFAPALLLLALGTPACQAQGVPAPAASAGAVPHPFEATALPNGFRFPEHDTVRVMTWNLENFVDLHDNPYNRSQVESRPDRRTLQERHETLAAFLRHLRPDVVVFQEVEGVPLLEELARTFFPELGFRFFGAADRGDWHQNVVVMSRLPLGVVRSFAPVTTPVPGSTTPDGEPETQSLVNHRMIVVDVQARPGEWFTLAGVHLKAGRTPRDRGHRRGQLEALRAELARTAALFPDAPLLVAGDLNMTPAEAEMALLTAGTPPLRFRDVLEGTDLLTHPSDAPTRRIDYLLVNPAMERRMVPGSGRVPTPFPPDITTLMSDHLPVVAEFLFR